MCSDYFKKTNKHKIRKKMIGKPAFQMNPIGIRPPQIVTPPIKDKAELIKGVNYVADNSGCSAYRMIWPSYMMNYTYNSWISDCRKVMFNEQFYDGVDVVRMQRQVSTNQFELFKIMRKICDKKGVRLVYELDDIPLYEDIPLYNRNRSSYARNDFRGNIIEMMNMSDEVTVTCKFMRDYFRSKISNQNITVIPNYIPKSWLDRYWDEQKTKINFSKHKKKPRILYAGSASHYGSGAVEDDFTKLEEFVRKTVNQYQWVFFGGISRKLVDLYKSGKIEFYGGCPVPQYPDAIQKLKIDLSIAPLLKNNFNRSKSNIKFIEFGAMGIPCICQSGIETYDGSLYTFDTPKELDDQIKSLTIDSNSYIKACRKSRIASEKYWLDDNLIKWKEFYDNPYGDVKRVELNKLQ